MLSSSYSAKSIHLTTSPLRLEFGLRRFSIYLLAFCTSLEGQTTVNLTVYATSAFVQHSLVATVYVVQNVVNGKRRWKARINLNG